MCISPAVQRSAFFLCMLSIVIFGCSERIPNESVYKDEPSAIDSRSSGQADQTSCEKRAGAAKAWIDNVLLATGNRESVLVEYYFNLAGLSMEEVKDKYGSLIFREQTCHGLTPDEIILFVEIGSPAIPELIKHVRCSRLTDYGFRLPRSSRYEDTGSMKVGEIACYLIEAIIRQTPFFASSANFGYIEFVGPTHDNEVREGELRRAATAYEEWYNECFDEERKVIICGEDKYPKVDWHYIDGY